MNIAKATRKYEAWMAEHCTLVHADLRRKHEMMRAGAFAFFRGTFYRWMQLWPRVCPEAAGAPSVAAVGDLHVENFGTWRDAEGRLVWGINDFDECARLPYTNDLIRLMASALLASREASLHLSAPVICATVLGGYRESLARGGTPFVFDGQHHALHHAVTAMRKPPSEYWASLASLPRAPSVDRRAGKALAAALPAAAAGVTLRRRTAGVGSLGRPRVVALAIWQGSPIAREVKAALPSAAVWSGAARRTGDAEAMVEHAVRSHDPTLTFRRRWTVRRLSPDCTKIALADLPGDRDERRLLAAMGAETANVHLGDRAALARIRADLRRRTPAAFAREAAAMVDAMTRDWKDYRRVT
jgi:hypothetical protein